MSIFKRKLDNGDESPFWYYRFKYKGRTYKASTGLTQKKEAEKFEKEIKMEIARTVGSSNPKQQIRALKDLNEKITDKIKGESISIPDTWQAFREEALVTLKRYPSDAKWKIKEGYWRDFEAFINKEFPDFKTLRDITEESCKKYISILKTKGKYRKLVEFQSKNKNVSYKQKSTSLAPATINEYITQLKQVFHILYRRASLFQNPFVRIAKVPNIKKKRDIFEIEELQKIGEYLKQNESEPDINIVEAVFIVGITTGLRKGDICHLKWSNLVNETLTLIPSKTNNIEVCIPVHGILRDFLNKVASSTTKDSEHIFPELALMYDENPHGISYRFKKMLKAIGIQNKKKHEGRSRAVSSKDIQSLRHTFCYLHGLNGTPLSTVRQMVGHMTDKMTEYYSLHSSDEAKRNAQKQLKNFSFLRISTNKNLDLEILNQIKELSDKLSNNRTQKAILKAIKIT